MEHSRLFKIFRVLSKQEIRLLHKFVRSPFHNQRTDVIQLFDYFRQHIDTITPNVFDKEVVFSALFPNESYVEKKIRYTMSFLYQTIKDFLAIRAFQQKKIATQMETVRTFRRKGVPSLFQQEWKVTQQLLTKSPQRNQQFYYQSFELENEQYLFSTSQNREKITGLVEASQYFDHYFIIQNLRQAANSLSHQRMENSNFQPQFLPDILAYLEQINIYEYPALAIYYHCYKILETDDALPYFQQLRQLMATHQSIFPVQELRDIYLFALNYCIKRLNAQEIAFTKEALELYKEGLQQKIFFENGYLSRFNYKNIVALGLALKEYDFVRQFIEAYKSLLEKKYQTSTYHYNLALFHYRTNDFDQAMTLLQQVRTQDVLDNLTARRLLVIIYYSKGHFDALYSLLDSFQNYIYRKSGVAYQRRMYLNFVKFTRKLLKLDRRNEEEVATLKIAIERTTNLVEKEWLLEQLKLNF